MITTMPTDDRPRLAIRVAASTGGRYHVMLVRDRHADGKWHRTAYKDVILRMWNMYGGTTPACGTARAIRMLRAEHPDAPLQMSKSAAARAEQWGIGPERPGPRKNHALNEAGNHG